MPQTILIAPVLADMVWPALFLEERILSVAPVAVGLIVEWLALWLGGFGLSWRRAILVDVAMNAVSTFAGIFAIPVLGSDICNGRDCDHPDRSRYREVGIQDSAWPAAARDSLRRKRR